MCRPHAASAAAATLLALCLCLLPPAPSAALSADDLLRVCRRSDPRLGDCIKQSVQSLLPALAKGIPELKIAPQDPLKVERLTLKEGTGSVSLDATFTNQIFHGLRTMELVSVKPDLEKNKISFTFGIKIPHLFSEGNYTVDGRILLLPLKGQGYVRTNYTGVTCAWVLRGHGEERKGREYLQLDDVAVDVQVKRVHFQLENLFGGDRVLGESVGAFLDDNWRLLFQELKPAVEQTIAALLKDTAQRVFRAFPLEDLLPQ